MKFYQIFTTPVSNIWNLQFLKLHLSPTTLASVPVLQSSKFVLYRGMRKTRTNPLHENERNSSLSIPICIHTSHVFMYIVLYTAPPHRALHRFHKFLGPSFSTHYADPTVTCFGKGTVYRGMSRQGHSVATRQLERRLEMRLWLTIESEHQNSNACQYADRARALVVSLSQSRA